MIEPPTLIQYVVGSFFYPAFSGSASITYQTGDTVLVFTMDGNASINAVHDTGGSVFTQVGQEGLDFCQVWYCLSAKGSSSVTVGSSVQENCTFIVAVFRAVGSIGNITAPLAASGTTITASLPVAAGSKLVGGLGVAYNGSGTVSLSGDAAGKTTHGDYRTSIGDGNTYPLLGLIDADSGVNAGSTLNLQLTASRSSNWQAIAIELRGQPQSYFFNDDLYVVGDVIDSDGLIHAAVSIAESGMNLVSMKGSFPCIPILGGAPVNQTYATGHVTTRFSFTYGTVEAKIKFGGFGVHSALWMLGVPSKPWPNYASGPGPNPPGGEVDIAELINNDFTHVRSAYANPTFDTTDTSIAFDPTADFHTYKLVWTASSLTWYIDGTQVKTASSAIPNYPMYVLVGGYMGEYPINDALLPQTTTVAYLNVSDATGNPVSNSGGLNVIPSPPQSSGGAGIPPGVLLAAFGGIVSGR